MAAPSHRSRGSDDGVFDDARTYYTEERHTNRAGPRTRTYSQVSSEVSLVQVQQPYLTRCM